MPHPTRNQLREVLADKICALPHSRLLQHGISRCGDVTGLDTIGLPVYTSCRPPGKVIAVSAGKGLTNRDAKAGAIIESIELWAAENPSLEETIYCNYTMTKEHIPTPCLPIEKFPLARDSILNPQTAISWDLVHDVFENRPLFIPSDLVWLSPRIKQPFEYFQCSSNGVATGVDHTDALLQATYELVERDGWALSDFIRAQIGLWPPRVSTSDVPPEIQTCIDHLYDAKVLPFIFDLSTEISVPIFSCVLVPTTHPSPGIFAGYGCSLDAGTAARRAITEAAQSRACYISGGRDDMFRRKFLAMKQVETAQMLKLYESLPVVKNLDDYPHDSFDSIEQEWKALSSVLIKSGFTDLYSKLLYQCHDPMFTIVRCICPSMAQAPWENWTHNQRCIDAVTNKIEVLK